eukprot:CAMPEP_0194482576 /NCGR_PEP_ID=MMETSP0253-20130528/4460_1 /TAXON_ID=2966 /ORGANISM="Noctiluca scintillans" /LENGTH=261 /DNA_ID=CAMNT_0039322119 /DNA_START=20 /DNA_END=805 /DNA_ORIENTATION=-
MANAARLVLAGLCAAVTADEAPAPASRATVLGIENFTEHVEDRGLPSFVKFYAPWCGHCKKLAPLWDDLAGKLEGKVQVATVDVTHNRWLADEWGVNGYPTLKLIAEGKVREYRGKRDVASMELWALEGFRDDSGESLPKDRTLWDSVWIFVGHYWFVVAFLVLFGAIGWLIYQIVVGDEPSPEDVERRREFRQRLAERERLDAQAAKERLAALAEKLELQKANQPGETQETVGADDGQQTAVEELPTNVEEKDTVEKKCD